MSAAELGWADLLDPDLLRAVFGEYPAAVLVTGDDNMPGDHPVVVVETEATIATVEPWDRRPRPPLVVPEGLSPDEVWKREVVQRWAHAMASQERRAVRRYSRERSGVWKRHVRPVQGRLFKS